MLGKIKISVVMAVYNAEKYVKEALDTIITQTLKDIEIICVDDGSTDSSLSILQEYARRDSRIKVLRHLEKTDGAAAARNMGMAEAKGEYLSFLDADDFFESDMLETAYERAKASDADVVIFDAYTYDNESQRDYEETWILNHTWIPKEEFMPQENPDHLFRIAMGGAWNGIFRTEFVRKHGLKFESIYHTDDQVFVYLAYALANKICVIDRRFVHYRKNGTGSQSADVSAHPESGYMAPLTLKRELQSRGIYDIYKKALAQLALEVAQWHLFMMRDWNHYTELYIKLKNSIFEELLVTTLTSLDVDESDIEWRDMVINSTPGEYLLKTCEGYKNEYEIFRVLPNKIKNGSRIVLYGAGLYGMEWFANIKKLKIIEIVNWVDRNYKNIGFPVRSVESIKETPHDYILVAIRSAHVYQAIVRDLKDMGINEETIVWVNRI